LDYAVVEVGGALWVFDREGPVLREWTAKDEEVRYFYGEETDNAIRYDKFDE
jgi:hypothetical protein